MSGFTIRTDSYLLNSEFLDGQPAGSITPGVSVTSSDRRSTSAKSSMLRRDLYTLALTDISCLIQVTSATPVTITIPTNASVAFPVRRSPLTFSRPELAR